ncbi:molybdate ABC transporter substrate-binding protein [Microbispora catharanthi]|uniref:molybdate ABC transporter substrate-binding protein n=1 Tax=Microbispora catharanthi TaxID=1712871 RepID=UPI001F0D4D02|nr:molybdate ABC transporter substrate-binding protein [Microbispora catharanthi]
MNHFTPPTCVALALVLLVATGCGGGGRQTLTVFADASLTGTFGSLGKTFEAAHPGVAVRFDFGGSGALAQRIARGAPADLFAAAGTAAMRGSGAPSPRVFARDSLQVAVPKGNPAHVAGLKDLTAPGVRVALCAESAPCGAGARTALAAAGVTVTPIGPDRNGKAPDAAKVLAKVRLGEADAALVYRTDVRAAAGAVEGVDLPEAARAVEDYLIATVPGTERLALTREFVDLVLSDEGRKVLGGAGFTPVTG